MTDLRETLQPFVDAGALAGAVALVAVRDRVEVAVVGAATLGGAPMSRDSIFRLASITKPITAAAVMVLVEDGALALEDPIAGWLPELAAPTVVRTPQSPVEDVIPAARPITVLDLLTFRAGYGFPADFSLPAVHALLAVQESGLHPQASPAPEEWLAALARVPMLHQPGAAWLYHTGSDILGALIARVADRPLPEFLAERVFAPLGMVDTGFSVPGDALPRFTTSYRHEEVAGLQPADAPDGHWSRPPVFPSAGGGLVSTLDDYHAFARMLLAGGSVADRRVLSTQSVRQMTRDHLTRAQREAGELFLEGQGWGFGGSVDVANVDPWNVPGRYGWVGGSGTAAHITPSRAAVSILLTQVEMTSPTPPEVMRAFWRYAADA